MFGTKQGFVHFEETNRRRLIEIADEIKALRKQKHTLLKTFLPFRDLINDFGSYTFKEMCTSESVKFSRFRFKLDIEIHFITERLPTLVLLNRKIREAQKRAEKYNCKAINMRRYCEIIKAFNRLVVEYMIKDNYTWVLGSRMGSMKIIRTNKAISMTGNGNLKQMVDWGSSIKNRDRMLEEGIPIRCDKDGLVGENWFVHYPEDYELWVFWSKARSINANIHSYKLHLVPEVARRLWAAQTEDTQLHLKYPYYDD